MKDLCIDLCPEPDPISLFIGNLGFVDFRVFAQVSIKKMLVNDFSLNSLWELRGTTGCRQNVLFRRRTIKLFSEADLPTNIFSLHYFFHILTLDFYYLRQGFRCGTLFSCPAHPAESCVAEKGPAGAHTDWVCPPDWVWFAHFINWKNKQTHRSLIHLQSEQHCLLGDIFSPFRKPNLARPGHFPSGFPPAPFSHCCE